MIRRVRVAVVVVVATLTLAPATALAGHEDPVYLSLGTSLAAGTLADETGANIPFSDFSYTDQLAAGFDDIDHIKLGCPGETVATFTSGGICYTDGVSQLSLAQDVLASRQVELVTIDMGANDFLQATPDILACGEDFACVFEILEGIAADVGGTIDDLRAANPNVRIVAMNYYNPSLAAWLGWFSGVPFQLPPDPAFASLTNTISVLGNDLIEVNYAARGVEIVDVEAAFSGQDFGDDNGNGVPNNVEVICALTFMCPDVPAGVSPNIHATPEGYGVIAAAFAEVTGEIGPGTPVEQLTATVAELQALIDADPDSDLADKVEDAVAGIETAIGELLKSPADDQAALGNLEGAAGDLEAALEDGLFDDPVHGEGFADDVTDAARDIAEEAGASDADLAAGDAHLAAGQYKAAIAAYLDAVS